MECLLQYWIVANLISSKLDDVGGSNLQSLLDTNWCTCEVTMSWEVMEDCLGTSESLALRIL